MNKRETLIRKLNTIANSLVPVAGAIMQQACGEEREHLVGCNCRLCQAFLATQKAITDLEITVREIEAGETP